jgi:hypothetical protein
MQQKRILQQQQGQLATHDEEDEKKPSLVESPEARALAAQQMALRSPPDWLGLVAYRQQVVAAEGTRAAAAASAAATAAGGATPGGGADGAAKAEGAKSPRRGSNAGGPPAAAAAVAAASVAAAAPALSGSGRSAAPALRLGVSSRAGYPALPPTAFHHKLQTEKQTAYNAVLPRFGASAALDRRLSGSDPAVAEEQRALGPHVDRDMRHRVLAAAEDAVGAPFPAAAAWELRQQAAALLYPHALPDAFVPALIELISPPSSSSASAAALAAAADADAVLTMSSLVGEDDPEAAAAAAAAVDADVRASLVPVAIRTALRRSDSRRRALAASASSNAFPGASASSSGFVPSASAADTHTSRLRALDRELGVLTDDGDDDFDAAADSDLLSGGGRRTLRKAGLSAHMVNTASAASRSHMQIGGGGVAASTAGPEPASVPDTPGREFQRQFSSATSLATLTGADRMVEVRRIAGDAARRAVTASRQRRADPAAREVEEAAARAAAEAQHRRSALERMPSPLHRRPYTGTRTYYASGPDAGEGTTIVLPMSKPPQPKPQIDMPLSSPSASSVRPLLRGNSASSLLGPQQQRQLPTLQVGGFVFPETPKGAVASGTGSGLNLRENSKGRPKSPLLSLPPAAAASRRPQTAALTRPVGSGLA